MIIIIDTGRQKTELVIGRFEADILSGFNISMTTVSKLVEDSLSTKTLELHILDALMYNVCTLNYTAAWTWAWTRISSLLAQSH